MKPPITFSVALTMKDRDYNSDYVDLTKPNTRGIIKDLTDIFEPFFKGESPDFRSITFRAFFSGSLGTNFDITFGPTSTVSKNSITQALQRGNGTSALRFELLGTVITVSDGPFIDSTAIPSTTPTG